MYASWQLDLQASQLQPHQLTASSVRDACGQFGSQFGETLADVTDGSATLEMLGEPTLHQNDAVYIAYGIAKKS